LKWLVSRPEELSEPPWVYVGNISDTTYRRNKD
jgi:hypothetical protein